MVMHTTPDDFAYCCACQARVLVNHRGVAFDDMPTCNECDSDELDFEYSEDAEDATART
jgi:hypothetical protein